MAKLSIKSRLPLPSSSSKLTTSPSISTPNLLAGGVKVKSSSTRSARNASDGKPTSSPQDLSKNPTKRIPAATSRLPKTKVQVTKNAEIPSSSTSTSTSTPRGTINKLANKIKNVRANTTSTSITPTSLKTVKSAPGITASISSSTSTSASFPTATEQAETTERSKISKGKNSVIPPCSLRLKKQLSNKQSKPSSVLSNKSSPRPSPLPAAEDIKIHIKDNNATATSEIYKIERIESQVKELRKYVRAIVTHEAQMIFQSATMIQSVYRGYKVWKNYIRHKRYAKYSTLLHPHDIPTLVKYYESIPFPNAIIPDNEHEHAAIIIQRVYRCHLFRKRFIIINALNRAATVIQSIWRSYYVRNHAKIVSLKMLRLALSSFKYKFTTIQTRLNELQNQVLSLNDSRLYLENELQLVKSENEQCKLERNKLFKSLEEQKKTSTESKVISKPFLFNQNKEEFVSLLDYNYLKAEVETMRIQLEDLLNPN